MTDAIREEIELHTGTYWKARKSFGKDSIKKGWVLLLESIKKVDNEPHTIILRGHPSEFHGDRYTTVTRKFLVQEFLINFEFVPEDEAKAIRQKELLLIQGKVQQIQDTLSLAASNPEVMQADVDKGIHKWEQEEKKVAPGSTAEIQAPTSAIVPLIPTMTVADVDRMKISLERQSVVAKLQAEWIKEKAEELGSTVKAMTPYITEQAAAALARTEDIRLKVDKIYSGIESLDLYVGKDVDIRTIAKGESAPFEVPLSIKQSKLYMDEEFCVWADIDETFDFHNVDSFFEVLAANKSLADQIFPSVRSIVCMNVRRTEKYYSEDARVNHLMNQRNKEVFLLVRDGENIHQVWSPIESHLIAGRLFPTKQEIDKIFQDSKWGGFGQKEVIEEINFMDTRYTDRLERHDAIALHYKRFLILMAGLDHRLELFGKFYNEPKGLGFVSARFQAEYFNLISDDETLDLRLTGEVRPKFNEWLASKNEYLRSGSRVMGYWRNVITSETAPGAIKSPHWNSRDDRDRVVAKPIEKYSIQIAYRKEKDILVKVPVKGEVYDREKFDYRDRVFDAAVNLSKYKHPYNFGFLVLDAVKAEELEYYINSRIERKDHVDYISIFKAAAKFLRAEEKQQEQTRHRLIEALHIGGIAEGAGAESIVDTAIMAYRAAERGAELPQPSDEKYKTLLNQMFQLSKGERRVQQAEALSNKLGLEPLRLSISGKSTIRLYCAPKPEERDDRLFPHSYVHLLTLQQSASGLRVTNDTWKELPIKNAAETVIHEWLGMPKWAGLTSPVSFEEKQELFEAVNSYKANLEFWTREKLQEHEWQVFNEWKQYRRAWQDTSKYVVNPSVVIPIGFYLEEKRLRFLCVGVNDAAFWIYNMAPTPEIRDTVMDAYTHIYKHKESNRKRLKESEHTFTVCTAHIDILKDSPGYGLVKGSGELGYYKNSKSFLPDAMSESIQSTIEELSKGSRGDRNSFYIAPGILKDEK